MTEPRAAETQGTDIAVGASDAAFDAFLDRLMRAESNGIAHAKNPRSSALGPFQFINSTFLAVMRQHFPDEVARLSESSILALRTRHDVARRAAKAFSKDNMAYLMERGVTPTFGHLRLAFLLGPEGAARVLKAAPERPVSAVLEGAVISANPFMRRMTVADLIARATRDVSPKEARKTIVADAAPPAPTIVPPAPAPAVKQEAKQPVEPSLQVAEAAPAPAPKAEPEAKAEAAAKVAPLPQPKLAEAQTVIPKTAPSAPKVAEAQQQTQPKLAEAQPSAPKAEGAPPKVAEPKAAETKVAEAKAPTRITARRLDRPGVINVTCDDRLASCRRWINQEVAKLIQVAESRD